MRPGDDPRAIVAAGYDALGSRFAGWSSGVRDPARDRLFSELVARLPAGARVLDVGCGSGTSWGGALAARFELTGIDISARQIAAARRVVPGATFHVGDMTEIEFPPATFDGVAALYSIGHLPSASHERVFERIARWLRPGGLLLASLPAVADPGWTGAWIDGVEMFFASLGAERYEVILRAGGWRMIEAQVAHVEEPDGSAQFLWVLARRPDADRG